LKTVQPYRFVILMRIVDAALSAYGPDAPGVLWVEAWRFAMRDPEIRADVL
jgi:hypothetical protein